MLRRIIALSVFALIPTFIGARELTFDGPSPVALVQTTYNDGQSGHATVTFAAGRIWTAKHVVDDCNAMKWTRGPMTVDEIPSFFHQVDKEDVVWTWASGPVPESAPIAKEMPKVGEELWLVGFVDGHLVRTLQYPVMLEADTDELFCDGWSWPGMSGGALLNARGELVGIDLGTVNFDADPRLRPLSRFGLVVGRK